MNLTEKYILLFTDSLISNLAINPSSELVISSMKVFNSFDPNIIIITASLAFAAASIINYIFGRLCHKILIPAASHRAKSLESKIERLGPFRYLILGLSCIPFFGKFILVFAGFCRMNLIKTIAIAFSVKFIYYIYFVVY